MERAGAKAWKDVLGSLYKYPSYDISPLPHAIHPFQDLDIP
jgi:hypothetical protein